jgi:hypothetical protein
MKGDANPRGLYIELTSDRIPLRVGAFFSADDTKTEDVFLYIEVKVDNRLGMFALWY